MPVGTYHELVGTLKWTELGYTLFLDTGGFWALDVPGRPDFYLGKYVRVQGYQAGFNILEVRAMGFADEHWTQVLDAEARLRASEPGFWEQLWRRLRAWLSWR